MDSAKPDGLNSLHLPGRPADTRVVVAMSGGVDSSVVAALLKREGYNVVGITLQLYDHGEAVGRKGACCAGQDIQDARCVAEALGIPHYVLDYEARFADAVMGKPAFGLQRGDFEQAGLFARAALQEADATLGADHRATETSLSTLSLALRLSGKPDEALPVAQRLVAVRARRYGPDDPATAIALHNTAEILIAQGRFAEAGKLQLLALAVFEKKLGEKHVHTATGLHNMGAILLKQEQYGAAEKYLRRALAAKQQALKPGHLSIAHTLDNLASALDAQGRNIEAEKYRRRAEGIRRKAS